MDINNLMKQAQQMQEKMSAMQEQAASAEVTGESGAGMVQVVMTCLLYTSPSPRDATLTRMPSSA